MAHLNVEIKASLKSHHQAQKIREYLIAKNADFKGVDNQTDTYFNVPNGRLKLREGNIENNLIFYVRNNQPGAKDSNFQLLPVTEPIKLKAILTDSSGIKTTVRKRREIYYLQNVKFHLDEVEGLGAFVEIEAGNILADLSKEELTTQCKYFQKEFGITQEDLIAVSYSDMILGIKA